MTFGGKTHCLMDESTRAAPRVAPSRGQLDRYWARKMQVISFRVSTLRTAHLARRTSHPAPSHPARRTRYGFITHISVTPTETRQKLKLSGRCSSSCSAEVKK